MIEIVKIDLEKTTKRVLIDYLCSCYNSQIFKPVNMCQFERIIRIRNQENLSFKKLINDFRNNRFEIERMERVARSFDIEAKRKKSISLSIAASSEAKQSLNSSKYFNSIYELLGLPTPKSLSDVPIEVVFSLPPRVFSFTTAVSKSSILKRKSTPSSHTTKTVKINTDRVSTIIPPATKDEDLKDRSENWKKICSTQYTKYMVMYIYMLVYGKDTTQNGSWIDYSERASVLEDTIVDYINIIKDEDAELQEIKKQYVNEFYKIQVLNPLFTWYLIYVFEIVPLSIEQINKNVFSIIKDTTTTKFSLLTQ